MLLVSAGTERMLVDFGKASWIDKARQQPDKVQQVFEKARTDGLFTTLDAVQSKLDQPLPLVTATWAPWSPLVLALSIFR